MNVYQIGTGLNAKGGALGWSETTSPRKPKPGSNRWYLTDADRAPLGPIPDEILSEVRAHFALTKFKEEDLPESFNMLTADHFSGLPVVGPELKDFFLRYCGADVQVIRLENLWSLPDKALVNKERFHINIYASFPSIDLKRTLHREATSPTAGMKYSITASADEIFVNQIDTKDIHIWRDEASSRWLCDDVFKDDMLAFRPKNYHFRKLSF